MKIRTVLATTVGVGIGYVLGARAGRDKFEELKSQAQRIVSDPDVRAKVSDLPNQVRENLPKAKEAVSDALKGAADKAGSASGSDTSGMGAAAGGPMTTFEATAPVGAPDGMGTSGMHDSLGTPDPFDTPSTFTAEPLDTPGTFETMDPEPPTGTPSTFGMTTTEPLDDPDAPTMPGSTDRT